MRNFNANRISGLLSSRNGVGVQATTWRTFLLTSLWMSAIGLMPQAATAVDGVIEINQTCAAQTGCFSGDTAGFPVTIDGSAGGSYRLTGDLIVPDENTSGIVVSTTDIGIDLNNFTIIRSGCEGATRDCTPALGTGSGVQMTSGTHRGLSVKNGSITGMGLYGVILGEQGEFSGLRLRWNRIDGISAGSGSTVSGNLAYENGRHGIFANPGSTVVGNTAFNNGDDGISVQVGSTVSGNTAFGNGGDGISAFAGSTVQQNAVRENRDYGLNLNPTAAYRENVITGNSTGTVLGGLNLGDNSCNGAAICP